jgi:NADH-quinone oxidoreductase subunit M
LLGALLLWLVPGLRRAGRGIALAWSVVELALAVVVAVQWAAADGSVRLAETHQWIPQFGVSYAVGLTGIGLTMVLLSALLVPLVLLAAWKEQSHSRRATNYAALILVLEAFMVAVFTARDIFFFYVLFEGMLIPVYFLIGSFGGERRRPAALKFLLYSLAGGLVMLAGVIAYWAQSDGGPQAFLLSEGTQVGFSSPVAERLIFLSFFVAFAIKAPMWPVHTWLPDAAQAAKPGTSVLLVGVLDKVGTYGMIALCLPLFPAASRWAAPVIVALAVVSVIWGALMAIAQKDILRMIAYTSVSHFGFIVLGVFAFTATSEVGASFYMVNHGLSTGALFLLAGFLIRRRGTQNIDEMGPGLQRTVPVLAGTFLVVGLSAVALPGLSTFISEFSVIVGAFQTRPAAAVIAALGVILAALYILIAYQKIFTGPVREDLAGTADLSGREKLVVGPLIAIMLVLGFYPAPALNTLRDDAVQTVQASQAQPVYGDQVVPAGAEEGSDQ